MLLNFLWSWSKEIAIVTAGLQAIGAVAIFVKLNSYNAQHEKLFKRAEASSAKPTASLFELPAFRRATTTQAPFENTTWRLTRYEQIKLSIVSVTLFPPRLIGFLSTFFWTFVFVALFEKLGLHRLAKFSSACGCRLVLYCFGIYWIEVKGRPASGVGAIVSNHTNFCDGFVWAAMTTPRIFAEKSNFQGPFWKVFADALDVVLFDRTSQESRRGARQIMADAGKEAVEGRAAPILVFPTGTTTNSKVMITFKDGAFAPGLPVQPALLRYHFKHCDPAWVFSGPSTAMLVWRMMSQIVNWLTIEFLPVATPTDMEKKEPSLYARRVQEQVAKAMDVPMTEHSVEDLQLQFAAVKANLPAEAGVVGFSALKDVFSVNAKQIKEQMRVFKEMDNQGTGMVTFEEFVDCFRRGFHEPSTDQTALLQEFFFQLTGGPPTLDFRKFLIGLALVNENEKSEEQATATKMPVDQMKGKIYAQLAFAAFAAENDDRISWREFSELWNWLHPSGVKDADEARAAASASLESTMPSASSSASLLSDPSSPTLRERGSTSRGSSWTCFSALMPSKQEKPQLTAEEEVQKAARKVFVQIGGEKAEVIHWDEFSGYAEKNPDFEKRLRQAFFSRVATDLAQSSNNS